MGDALLKLKVCRNQIRHQPDQGKKYSVAIDECNALLDQYDLMKDIKSEDVKKVKCFLGGLRTQVWGYDLFGDYPLGHTRIHPFAKKILFPKARFISIRRDQDSWLKSAIQWKYSHPETYGFLNKENLEYQKKELLREWRLDWKRIDQLHKSLPDDVLIVDITDRWEPLCEFFKRSIPDYDFPHLNKSTV